VRKSVKKKVGNVLISQAIKDVFAVAPPRDQPFVAKDAEPL